MSKTHKYECDPHCWVDAYADELFRFTFSKINNREQAEDIVQETFFSALKNLDSFRRDCTEKTWLYNILRNKITDYYRKNTRTVLEGDSTNKIDDEHFYQRFFRSDGMYIGHWKAESSPQEWDIPADQELLSKEFMAFLEDCLSYLPDKQAEVFRLKNMEDFSSDEICKELSVSASNLWVLVHRAKLQLRECLEKKGISNA